MIKLYGEEATYTWMKSLDDKTLYLLNQDPYFTLREKQILSEKEHEMYVDEETGMHKRIVGMFICCGRSLAYDTDVLTKDGWKKHGELKVGDVVYDEEGKECNVTGVYPQPPKKAYRLTFTDGTTVDACHEHLWTVWSHKSRKQYLRQDRPEAEGRAFPPNNWAAFRESGPKTSWGAETLNTQQLVDNFTHSNRKDSNWCVPMAKPIQMPEQDLEVEPYFAGIFVGDGHKNSGAFTCHIDDKEVYKEAGKNAGYEVGRDRHHGDHENNPNTWKLSFLGMKEVNEVFKDKIIPEKYLKGSVKQRLAFLQGLMDSDGYAAKSSVEFCSMTLAHAEAVFWLATSLGQRPTINTGRAMLKGKDYGTKYRVTWKPSSPELNPFRMERKASKVIFDAKQQSRNQHRMMISFEDLGVQSGYNCISVDSPNRLYLVTKSLIATHNSFGKNHAGSSWIISRAARGLGPIALVGTTASDVRETMVKGLSGILALSPKDFMPEYYPSVRTLKWPNGVTATTYSADNEEQVRGGNFQTVLMDEICKWQSLDETLSNIRLATRIGDHPMFVVTSTPKPQETIRKMYDDPSILTITGSTFENKNNPQAFLDAMVSEYGGTSRERQELYGEIVWESSAAQWNRDLIQRQRAPAPTSFHNIVIALDPTTGTGKKRNDEAGLGILGSVRGSDGMHAYLLEDRTVKGDVETWAKATKMALDDYPQATIIAEDNQGGVMVTEVLTKYGIPKYKIKLRKHITSKFDRATPIALLTEQGKVHFCQKSDRLEDELCSYTGEANEKSPNRLDFFVIGVHELLVAPKRRLTVTSMF